LVKKLKELVALMGDLGQPGSVVEMEDERRRKICGKCARPASIS
jgi:hypothetical protein